MDTVSSMLAGRVSRSLHTRTEASSGWKQNLCKSGNARQAAFFKCCVSIYPKFYMHASLFL